MDKHYLTEVPREELKDMILYPAEVWNELYEMVVQHNGDYACDLANWILGKDYQKWTKFDSCSYDWWMHIKEGQYENVLDITDYDYFSEDDKREIIKLQAEVKKLVDKIGDLEDSDDYYDKLYAMEDEADELADKIIQIVVEVLKQAEEVTDDQCLEFFIDNEMGDNYYWLGDDKTKVYRDYTKSYKTNYKKGQ